MLLRTNTSTSRRLNILWQADGTEGLNSILDLTVNLYLFLEPVHLNLSSKLEDQYFSCVDGRPEFVIKMGRYYSSKVNFFLFHPAGAAYFFEVPMNRFWTAGSGAQLSGKVTLKHAHSSCFAHPTATFDPSIHISIEIPTRWYQKEKNAPALRAVVGLARLVAPQKIYIS